MDVSYASYYIFNEKGNKGSQMGTPKKHFKKLPITEINGF
jgi:hypothetical protein